MANNNNPKMRTTSKILNDKNLQQKIKCDGDMEEILPQARR